MSDTDWSKFQRRELYTLLAVQQEIGKGVSSYLDAAIPALKATMEVEDVERVVDTLE